MSRFEAAVNNESTVEAEYLQVQILNCQALFRVDSTYIETISS